MEENLPYSHRKAFKLAALAEYLRGKPRTKDEMLEHFAAREMKLSKSGLERIIRELTELKVGLEHVPDNFTTHRQFFIRQPPRSMSPLEALLTHSAVRLVYHHSPGYQDLYLTALENLSHALPEPARETASRSTQDLRQKRHQPVKVGDSEIDLGKNLEMVARAWFERRLLGFEYLSPGGSGAWRKKELCVYFVEISRTNLEMYAIGHEGSFHRKTMTFKLNRMRQPLFLGGEGAYALPQDFDPRAYLSSAWGVIGNSGGGLIRVRLRFCKEAAYRIREAHYPGLEIEHQDEGGVLQVSLTVGTDNAGFPLEILSWVQGWGSRVEVLEPQNLRTRWLEEAQKVSTMTSRGPVQDF